MFLDTSLKLFLINFGRVLRGYGTPKREAKMQQQESTVWESFWHQFLKGLDKGKKGKKEGNGTPRKQKVADVRGATSDQNHCKNQQNCKILV